MIEAARLWQTNIPFEAHKWIMPNYEKEAETLSPTQVKNELNTFRWGGNVGWSMQGWLPNSVDYSPINKDPVLLQIFPADMKANFPDDTRHDPVYVAKIAGDCVWHARVEKGFQYVGVTWQTYSDMTSADFDCGSFMHSTFPGNVIQPNQWDGWYQ